MENIKIENIEQPFLVHGFDDDSSSTSSGSPRNPSRRFLSKTTKQQSSLPDVNTDSGFYNNTIKSNKSRRNRGGAKYDYVSSKVKEYRIAIRNQTTKRTEKMSSTYEDTPETTTPEDVLTIIEKLKQDIKIKNDIINRNEEIIDKKDEEIAELIGKHIEEVALLKISLDSFRYEVMRLKRTIDMNRPYPINKQNSDCTPLKSFGNMLKTPIRSISNALLRTPVKTVTNSEVQNKSITSDDVEAGVNQNPSDESPFLKSHFKKTISDDGFLLGWTKIPDNNTASSASKTSSDPTLKTLKEPKKKKKNVFEQSVSNVLSKVVSYSQKMFTKNVNTVVEDTATDDLNNPQTNLNSTFTNPSIRNTRRRVSFSKTYTESPLPKVIVEDTTRVSPKNNFPPSRKIKKIKIHKYIPTKSKKENHHTPKGKKHAKDYCNYKDPQTLITSHIDETIARLEEIKRIMKNFKD